MAGMLDTIEIARRLQKTGFQQDQAEAIAQVVLASAEAYKGDLATKADLLQVKTELKGDIRELRAELEAEIDWIKKALYFGFGIVITLLTAIAVPIIMHLLFLVGP